LAKNCARAAPALVSPECRRSCGFSRVTSDVFVDAPAGVAITLHGIRRNLIADGIASGRYDFGIAESSVERPRSDDRDLAGEGGGRHPAE